MQQYVKSDSVAVLGLVSAIMNFVLYGLLDLGALITAIVTLASGAYVAALLSGIAFVLLAAFIVYNILTVRGVNGQERRRQAAGAASLAHRLRQVGQPMAPLLPLSLPARLELRLRLSYAIPYYGAYSLLLGFIFGGSIIAISLTAASSIGVSTSSSLTELAVGSSLGLALALFVMMFLLGYFITRESIEVTPFGVRVRRGFSDRIIRWEDIILAAQVRTLYLRAAPSAYYQYELSNPYTIVRFFRLYRDRSIFKPTIPFADYAQTMELFLAYISARTGLLIYDLRADQSPVPTN